MTKNTETVFVLFNTLYGIGKVLEGVKSWEEAAAAMDDWANSGLHEIRKVTREVTVVDLETRRFDTNWDGFGPKGYVDHVD